MYARLRQALLGSRFGLAEVTQVQSLTPHMIRVTLRSEMIRDFSPHAAGGHFKMIVPAQGETPAAFEDMISGGKFKSEMRTYTIRHVRPERQEIDVDIVTHGDLGRVGPWAQRTQAGDTIAISRCGSPKLITHGMTRILAAADMTGFPALAAGLETLGGNVRVDAYVGIPTADDKQPVDLPDGVSINWIVDPDVNGRKQQLIEAMRYADKPDERTSIFVAAEFTTVGALRRHFRDEIHVPKERLYISSYWKSGLDEPSHKMAKAAA
ncbi:MAG: siderophore-interacting protein [Parvularculaceae bacterium]|nr:siderophore-interacting protein [Parvularculaceae bacterium]